MTQVIVTTTINPPTEALRKFAELPDWHVLHRTITDNLHHGDLPRWCAAVRDLPRPAR